LRINTNTFEGNQEKPALFCTDASGQQLLVVAVTALLLKLKNHVHNNRREAALQKTQEVSY